MTDQGPNVPDPRDDERQRRQKGRNRAVLFILLGFAVLVYAITIVKIKLGYKP